MGATKCTVEPCLEVKTAFFVVSGLAEGNREAGRRGEATATKARIQALRAGRLLGLIGTR